MNLFLIIYIDDGLILEDNHYKQRNDEAKSFYKREGQEEFATFVDPLPNPSLRKVEARMALEPKFTDLDQKMSAGDSSSAVFIGTVH